MSVRAGSHRFFSANVCLEELVDVYLNRTQVFLLCQCLSSRFDLCLPELVPKVSSLQVSVWRYQLVVSLGGFQDSVFGSISSHSYLLNHKVLIKTVQVQQLAIKILIDSMSVSRIPKVREQSNLDYSFLK